MFARVSIYEIADERRDEARTNFQQALGQLRDINGLRGAYFMLGSESDRAITITLWEDQIAMDASRVTASRLRSEAAASVEADIVSVEEYEVVAGE